MTNENDQLQIIINEAKETLSKESIAAINNVNWKTIIYSMNDTLNEDQIITLGIETELLLYGIISPSQYEQELKDKMFIKDEDLDKLLKNLDNLIFKKIQDELINIIENKVVNIDTKITKNSLNNDFINLPKEVQEAISGSNYQSELYKIAENHKLNVEQMGILEEITTKVMLNTIHPDQYEVELKNKINLPSETVGEIVNEVNEKVLKTIREKLKLITGENNTIGSIEIEKENIPIPPYKTIKNTDLPKQDESQKYIIKNIIRNDVKVVETSSKTTTNPLEEKIVKPVSSGQTVSDYSNIKTIPKVEDIKRSGQSDPYREMF